MLVEKVLAQRGRAQLTVAERSVLENAIGDVRDVPARSVLVRAGEPIGVSTLLLEGPSPKTSEGQEPSWQGRDPYGVPVHVPLPAGIDHTGRLVQVTVTEAKKHSLMAVRAGEPW